LEERKIKYKIMIVENSETQTVILRYLLEKQGWEVSWADSAEKALGALEEKKDEEVPNLIVLDYRLPGIQGDEFCRKLKENPKTRRIITLMLTGEEGDENQNRIQKNGADDFFPKYSDEDLLILKINSLLRKSREADFFLSIDSSAIKHSRILAIDDSPTYLEFLEESFREDGIYIDKTTDVNEALEKIKRNKYDCVLLDLVMPEVDGIEFCQKILEMRRFLKEHLVILMLTAHESKDDMTRALKAGADDFVGKSNDFSIIKARMMALLRRKFILEENQRIFEELKRKEMEIERSRIEKEAAEAKGILAEKLLDTVEQLEEEIEERKRMEQKIKDYSLELEHSNKELESFAYVVSHDLQEPLRAISNYIQLIEKRLKDKLDKKAKDFIQRAVLGANRMQEMINELLKYSRVTSRSKLFAIYSSEEILKLALENLSPDIERKKAHITYDPLPEITCDNSQILRLFQNLISNAVKFCDRVPAIHISAAEEKKWWLFSIKDNGIGIEPPQRELIFKIFHKSQSKDKYPGTGIGLAICQKIVERHGGKIWVESQPDKGSTFFFSIATPKVKKEKARDALKREREDVT